MRKSSNTQIILLVLLVIGCCFLLRRTPATLVRSNEKRWVIHNGYCVRPYLHAGEDVTARLLNSPSDQSDFVLSEMPRDDPRVFQDDLTLLAHTSASAIDEVYLSKLISNWRGPISLAVSMQGAFNEDYVTAKIDRALRLLKNYEGASRFSVHVMLPRIGKKTCAESESHHTNENADQNTFFATYPINTVRNVARLFSSTRYIAFADADYIFSAGFYKKILSILRENVSIGSKNALLYRIFEVEDNDSRLRNHQLKKSDLVELITDKKARVFHSRKTTAGHGVPKLKEWLREPESESPGISNFTISLKKREFWEFQFAALRDVPSFDENFPYRVNNNLELRWEVCRAGYHLLPAEDLFVYHTLSHDEHNKDDSGRKNAIKKKNYSKYVKAKKELVKRMQRLYPHTKDRCPV